MRAQERAPGTAFATFGRRGHAGLEQHALDCVAPDVVAEVVQGTADTRVAPGRILHIDNTLDKPLRFANEAIDGEMCILFGSYIGSMSPCSAGAQRVTDDSDGVSL